MIESAYNSNTTYAKNDVATVAGTRYASLTDSNIGSQPATSPAAWSLAQAGISQPQGNFNYGLGRTGESHLNIPMPTGVAGPSTLADGTPTAWGTLGKRVSDLEIRLRVIEVQLSAFHTAFGSVTPASFESATPGAYAAPVPPGK